MVKLARVVERTEPIIINEVNVKDLLLLSLFETFYVVFHFSKVIQVIL